MLYAVASFLGFCLLVLVILFIYIIYNICKNRVVKKEKTLRPHPVMLMGGSFPSLFFSLLLFQIGIFEYTDRDI